MQNATNGLVQERLMTSQEDMDFTLKSHYLERVNHHMKMLKYYLDESLGT